jgi:hypothetical protein
MYVYVLDRRVSAGVMDAIICYCTCTNTVARDIA